MRIRRLPAVAFLSILVLLPLPARAQSIGETEPVLRNAQMARDILASRVRRLGVSAGPDPDTVYVGKSVSNHTAPDNYWNVYTGTHFPGVVNTTNAIWEWDNTAFMQAPDSLQGWWPVHRQYNTTGG